MTPEHLLTLVAARSQSLQEPIGGAAPTWTLAEAGYAAAGLTRAQAAAMFWRYMRDDGARRVLWACLLDEAARLFTEERWPDRIAGRLYLVDLVELAIAEETLSDVDRQRLRDRLPGRWPEGVWNQQLAKRYAKVGAILDAWCAEAHRHMARRIRSEDAETA